LTTTADAAVAQASVDVLGLDIGDRFILPADTAIGTAVGAALDKACDRHRDRQPEYFRHARYDLVGVNRTLRQRVSFMKRTFPQIHPCPSTAAV
jgi:hypothetical protein